MADTHKCAMNGCLCMVPAGQKFCSNYCEAAKNTIKLQCDCGHPACEGSVSAGGSGARSASAGGPGVRVCARGRAAGSAVRAGPAGRRMR